MCSQQLQVEEKPALLPEANLDNFCLPCVPHVRFGALVLALRNVHNKRHGCGTFAQHVDHAAPEIGGLLVCMEGGAQQRCARHALISTHDVWFVWVGWCAVHFGLCFRLRCQFLADFGSGVRVFGSVL